MIVVVYKKSAAVSRIVEIDFKLMGSETQTDISDQLTLPLQLHNFGGLDDFLNEILFLQLKFLFALYSSFISCIFSLDEMINILLNLKDTHDNVVQSVQESREIKWVEQKFLSHSKSITLQNYYWRSNHNTNS